MAGLGCAVHGSRRFGLDYLDVGVRCVELGSGDGVAYFAACLRDARKWLDRWSDVMCEGGVGGSSGREMSGGGIGEVVVTIDFSSWSGVLLLASPKGDATLFLGIRSTLCWSESSLQLSFPASNYIT